MGVFWCVVGELGWKGLKVFCWGGICEGCGGFWVRSYGINGYSFVGGIFES